MQLKHINHCVDYFYYGQIDDRIIADSYSWEEDETIELQPVINFINQNSTKPYIYLMSMKCCSYPLSTSDKYLKLWNSFGKRVWLRIYKKKKVRKVKQIYGLFGCG